MSFQLYRQTMMGGEHWACRWVHVMHQMGSLPLCMRVEADPDPSFPCTGALYSLRVRLPRGGWVEWANALLSAGALVSRCSQLAH